MEAKSMMGNEKILQGLRFHGSVLIERKKKGCKKSETINSPVDGSLLVLSLVWKECYNIRSGCEIAACNSDVVFATEITPIIPQILNLDIHHLSPARLVIGIAEGGGFLDRFLN